MVATAAARSWRFQLAYQSSCLGARRLRDQPCEPGGPRCRAHRLAQVGSRRGFVRGTHPRVRRRCAGGSELGADRRTRARDPHWRAERIHCGRDLCAACATHCLVLAPRRLGSSRPANRRQYLSAVRNQCDCLRSRGDRHSRICVCRRSLHRVRTGSLVLTCRLGRCLGVGACGDAYGGALVLHDRKKHRVRRSGVCRPAGYEGDRQSGSDRHCPTQHDHRGKCSPGHLHHLAWACPNPNDNPFLPSAGFVRRTRSPCVARGPLGTCESRTSGVPRRGLGPRTPELPRVSAPPHLSTHLARCPLDD